jgi:hypothetical protein
VIAGGADGLLRFWDAPSGQQLWTLPAHKPPVVGIHLEGPDVVTRGFAGKFRVGRCCLRATDRCLLGPRALRYRSEMKKASRKLVLRTETLRDLSTANLQRAVGAIDSGDKQGGCIVIAIGSGDHHCIGRVGIAGGK